jgi:uncharacterized membrane protein
MRHVCGKPEYDHGLYYQGKSMIEDDLRKLLVEISTIYVMIIYYIITIYNYIINYNYQV